MNILCVGIIFLVAISVVITSASNIQVEEMDMVMFFSENGNNEVEELADLQAIPTPAMQDFWGDNGNGNENIISVGAGQAATLCKTDTDEHKWISYTTRCCNGKKRVEYACAKNSNGKFTAANDCHCKESKPIAVPPTKCTVDKCNMWNDGVSGICRLSAPSTCTSEDYKRTRNSKCCGNWEYTMCSKPCGGGTSQKKCVKLGETVVDSECEGMPHDGQTKTCNIQKCGSP